MINLFRKFNRRQYKGFATLLITTILMLTSTLIILFAASYTLMSQKITSNQYRTNQAFEAAEAGLDFGIGYLQTNSSTILASRSGGYVQPYSDANTNNVTMPDSSKYTIVYTNPIANNYNLILVTSTGTSADGTATRVVSQLVNFGSLLFLTPKNALTSLGSVNISSSAVISNTSLNKTITSGSTVKLNDSSKTLISTGTGSTPSFTGSDISQNASALSSLSQSDFFATYFGVPSSTIKSNAAHYYQNSATTNYNSLNGMNGTSIWIDQNGGFATFNNNTTIGTAASPTLLVINGIPVISGNVTINGLLVVLGSSAFITNTVTINGGILTSGTENISGSTVVNYNSSILTALQQLSSMMYYARVPGSWKDY